MNRRSFIVKSIAAGLFGGSTIIGRPAFALNLEFEENVIVSGSTSAKMFTRGIKILGGIERYVKKGQRVVIKPNMSYDKKGGLGFTTDPQLVKEIINQCYEIGARSVSVFDHTYDSWTKCYKNSGIERIAKDANARVSPANNGNYYTEVWSDRPEVLKSVKIHNSLLEADVFINVAVLTTSSSNGFSASVKNLMGCIWDREFYMNNNLDKCLAEFLFYKKPDLNIVEGLIVEPGISVKPSLINNIQVISNNIIEADSIVAQLQDIDLNNIPYLKYAGRLGFGDSQINLNNIKRIIL
jgi:uncharacterized protein (DUF362 family)